MRAVRQVSEYADAVLDALVINVCLFDGLLDEVDEAVDKAVTLTKLLAAVISGGADVAAKRDERF